MKLKLIVGLIAAVGLMFTSIRSYGQSATTTNANSGAEADTNRMQYVVVERGADHRVWQRTTAETNYFGRLNYRTNSYTELATGLHYLSNGSWVESKEEIELMNGGAAATNGAYKVIFTANINTVGAVDMTTPDNKRLRSRIMGLSYFDGSTGTAVLIAEIKDSIGGLIGKTQILYTNAFDDVQADVQYIYKRSGLSQNIILRTQLPSPAQFGLNPATTRLQVLTEFFNAPEPRKIAIAPNGITPFPDMTLDFGEMKIGPGRGFSVGEEHQLSRPLRVLKEWAVLGGRTFLVEEVPFQQVDGKLKGLQTAKQGASLNLKRRGKGEDVMMALKDVLPKQMVAKPKTTGAIHLAKIESHSAPGFVLDYEAVSSTTNFTFLGDRTYFISGTVTLSGTNTLEGGAVIKHESGSAAYHLLELQGPLVCKTAPYRPAVFTSKNDNTVGETISGSTGSPSISPLFYIAAFAGGPWDFKHVRMSYGFAGFIAYDGNDVTIRNCQFVNSSYGAGGGSGDVTIENVLFANCDVPVYANENVVLKHVTAHTYSTFCMSDVGFSGLAFTNSLLIGTNNWTGRFSGSGGLPTPVFDHTTNVSSSAGLFQTVGAGSYYLAANSPYRNAGTTNLNNELLTILRRTTTYPPLVYSNVTFSYPSVLGPQAQRDSDVPDLGYHYTPLDYAFGGVELSTSLTFSPGTAVGAFRTASAGHSIHVDSSQKMEFDGRVDAPDYFVRYNTVQEQFNGNWVASAGNAMIIGSGASFAVIPEVRMRFTVCSGLSQEQNFFREGSDLLKVSLRDSEFYGAGIGGYVTTYGMTNCLLHRVSVWLVGGVAEYFSMRNCTVVGSGFTINRWPEYWGGPGTGLVPVTIIDCAFDNVQFIYSGDAHNTDPNWTRFANNAYITNALQTAPPGTNVITVTNFNWQTSFLGSFYLPGGSSLVNAGSEAANGAVGLYHFTMLTNQVGGLQIKETNSVVDIGYHYVAVNSSGQPIDADSDGTPDYWEDFNGNGNSDSGETDWNNAADLGLKVRITRPKKNSPLP